MKHTSLLVSTLTLLLTLAVGSLPAVAGPTLQEETASASSLLEQRDYAGAKAALDAHLEKNPQDAEAWQQMGLACFGLRWFEDATTSFARADELKPDDGLTLYYQAVLILIGSTSRDKEVRALFDRSAALESPVQASANIMKFAMMKYITIPGRSVTKEFDAWRKALDQDSWVGQTAHYMRRPVSNEKYTAQMESHRGEMDDRDLELQMRLFVGLRCERNLYGLATDSLKAGLKINRPGSVEWELCRVWFTRIGLAYNWDTNLGFRYAPNESGVLQVAIRDRESFALARGLKNGDVIVELDGMEADLNLLDIALKELRVGDTYELTVLRDGETKKVMLIVDTMDYRMRAVTKRPK